MAGEEIQGYTPEDRRRVDKAVRLVEQQPIFRGGGGQRPQPPNEGEDGRIILVNTSGEAVPAWGVCGVKRYSVISETPFIEIEKPSTTLKEYVFNGSEPIAIGGTGAAQKGPHWRARYDTGTPAIREGWGVKPGQWTLAKGYPTLIYVRGIWDSTAKIIHGEYRPITTLLGKSVTALTANTSYTTSTNIKIYGGTFGSEADVGFTTIPTARSRTAIAIDKWIKLTLINGYLEVEPLEC